MTIEINDHVKELLKLTADKKIAPRQLADELGCSVPSVYRLLRKYTTGLKSVSVEEAIRKYQDGTPVHVILEETGVNPNELYTALRTHNIPLRKEGKEERDALIIELYKNPNNTIFDIEIASQRSTTYIYKVLHQHGVPLRRGNDGLVTIEEVNFDPEEASE